LARIPQTQTALAFQVISQRRNSRGMVPT